MVQVEQGGVQVIQPAVPPSLFPSVQAQVGGSVRSPLEEQERQ